MSEETLVKLELNLTEFKKLSSFLDNHEVDIATDFEDFADLKGIFKVVYENATTPNKQEDEK